MSDADKPTNDPQSPATPEASPRQRTLRERLRSGGGKPPSLETEDLSYGFGAKPGAFDAELERELERDLQEAMGGVSDSDLKELYGEGHRQKPAERTSGAVGRKGKVISVRGKDVFVDVGGRIQGFLPISQFEEGPPEIGAEVEVFIEGHDPDGLLVLTRRGAAVEADWSTIATGMLVEARVTATNKGGLSVEVNGIRGFMPISQIEAFRIDDLTPYVNQKLRCLVTEVDREDRNLVVSRRALLDKEREEAREKLWAEIGEGQIREGMVRSVKPFGAFVDLGGADGLLPIGEMSWTRIKDPSEVVQPGQKVRVVVLRVDREARKLTLGLRQLSMSPWDNAVATYPPGEVVKGKVTRVADFGAFVEVEPGIEGLVHISELAPTRVNRVSSVVKVDQEVTVKVLNIEPDIRRLSLSIKAALKEPEPEATEDEDEAEEQPPPKPRAIPLRGGVGGKLIPLPKPEEEKP